MLLENSPLLKYTDTSMIRKRKRDPGTVTKVGVLMAPLPLLKWIDSLWN